MLPDVPAPARKQSLRRPIQGPLCWAMTWKECHPEKSVWAAAWPVEGEGVVLLTLAELHVLVLTSFIRLIKLLQNLLKLLPNHIMV